MFTFNISIAEGMPVKFKCCLDGQPMPTVQWFLNDKEISNGDEYLIYSDFNDQFLFIPKCKAFMSGKVSLRACNPFGSAESSCVLAVEGELCSAVFEIFWVYSSLVKSYC